MMLTFRRLEVILVAKFVGDIWHLNYTHDNINK